MIYCVLPTIRPEAVERFKAAWEKQFDAYNVTLIVVHDGERPYAKIGNTVFSLSEIMKLEEGLISNFNSSVRNLGFALAKKLGADVILTLDDDCEPRGDTIGDHLDVLHSKKPISWFSTTIIKDNGDYMRGFPYKIREEAQVMLSHGVWEGVPDRDAPTQLVYGAYRPTNYYKGPIPKGVLFPFCGMNVMFKIEALPYIYYAPVGQLKGAERFDDIFAGVAFKPDFDTMNWAIATGYATVNHTRASDVFTSLTREVIGIKMNETHTDPWFEEFKGKRARWKTFIESM